MKWGVLVLVLCLSGCFTQSQNMQTTELREYTVDGIHIIIGVGKWEGNFFKIKSFDGNTWDIPKTVTIEESPVSLESFKRITK